MAAAAGFRPKTVRAWKALMPRVLVVDDEEGIRTTFTAFLQAEGFEAHGAGGVDEALALLSREHWDVVVSDIAMPVRNGMELLELAHELTPEIKVILVTGRPSVDSAAEAVRAKAFDYLTKPVSRSALVRSVRSAANVKSLEDDARHYRRHLETVAAERTRQLAQWERRVHSLAERARNFATDSGLAGLARQTLDSLAQVTFAESGSVYLRSEGRFRLIASLQAPHAAEEIPLPPPPDSVVGRLVAEPVPILVQDAERELDSRSPDPEQYSGRSFIGLPCLGPENDVEILVFLYNRRDGGFSEHDLAMGRIVVARVEDALRSARLSQALEEGEARGRMGQPQILLDQADQIFRTVRHEIGNALNTLKTTLAVLRANITSFDDPKRDEYLARCLESLRLAEQMLNALKAFQHVDQVRLVHLDLARFLSEKEGFLFAAARSRGVDGSLVLHCSTAMVDADPDALLRILLNLVENAATAVSGCENPGIVLECFGDGDAVTVRVADNGVGIPDEHVRRVFEPLFSTKPGGSGMGLAIVQRLAARMAGTITLHSELRRGTRVAVTLPRCDGTGCRGALAEDPGASG